jgi:CRISPR-associated endonuclease Csy4
MDSYADIGLLPDPEFRAPTLMNALFEKFHRTLAIHGVGGIGVSFPDVKEGVCSLGCRLRLHGTADELKGFMATGWLVGMQDHLLATSVTPLPASAKHRVVSRVQAKSNPERLRRRMIARKGVTPEVAMRIIPDHVAERLNLPYVILTSRSSGHRFRLFIRHQPIQEVPTGGCFSGYGFGKESTVPWF